MGMPEAAGTWTRDLVLALPGDGDRYELFDGERPVSPAPLWITRSPSSACTTSMPRTSEQREWVTGSGPPPT
jgi:hypothetical protein